MIGMSRRSTVTAVVTATLVVALAGCAPAPASIVSHAPQSAPSAVAGPPKATPGVFNESLAYQTAWHVEVTSTFVNGSADTCDLNLGISFQDQTALSSSDTTIPVYGFVVQHSGEVSYGTVWPTADPGTGIIDGTGTITVVYDDRGLPTTGDGTADLTWHDVSQSPAKSHRNDKIHLTFAAEPRSKVCP